MEYIWLDDVEESPQLSAVVLNGSTSQKEDPGAEELSNHDSQLARAILEPLSFVHNNMLEGNFLENVEVRDQYLVVGEKDLKAW